MTNDVAQVEAMSAPAFMTAEELQRLELPDKRTELVRGVLYVREPAGYQHGDVAARMLVAIGAFVYANGLGKVFTAETGFTLTRNPDTVRAPDVAFVCAARLPATPPPGFPEFAPDLAVEVLSPDDRPGEVLGKVASWLQAGARLVWVVDPVRRLARVYRADGSQQELEGSGELSGEDVLPGFAAPLLAFVD